jgi:hypothetical protein
MNIEHLSAAAFEPMHAVLIVLSSLTHAIWRYQKVASAVLKSQEARRTVQGGVMKKMQELEAKSGTMKSSKVRICWRYAVA